MSRPAHVTLSASLPIETHATLYSLVALAAELSRCELSQCEVHVKQGSTPAHGISGSRSSMSGVAYHNNGKPLGRPIRVQPGIRQLVTLRLTRDFQYGVYPFVWHYARYKTAPHVALHDWREEFVHLCCHEFTHVHQYVHGLQRSEIHCELHAQECVEAMRDVLRLSDALNSRAQHAAKTR